MYASTNSTFAKSWALEFISKSSYSAEIGIFICNIENVKYCNIVNLVNFGLSNTQFYYYHRYLP